MSEAGDMIDERLLMKELKSQGVFKFGNFSLKSGQITPIYIDLRVLFTSPQVLRLTAECLCDLMEEKNLKYDYIVGVPYAALPLSTLIADRLGKPMLLRRKEVKSYGTKKLIEGKFEVGKRALIIEDVVVSGGSILETVVSLRNEGLVIEDAVCVLNREQGGQEYLKSEGTNLHSLLTMTKILDFLIDVGTITPKKKEDILYQLSLPLPKSEDGPNTLGWSLTTRKNATQNLFNKKLMEIMNKKKTCLCLALDSPSCEEVLRDAEKAADYVCAIKIHADILHDFSDDFIQKLSALANNRDFILVEDRKLADIGNTVNLQLTQGFFKVSSWAHLVTIHALSGQSVLNVIRKARFAFIPCALKWVANLPDSKLAGCLLVVELSSEGALTNAKGYVESSVELAKNNRDIVSGFICQKRCANDAGFLYWTAGVHMDSTSDGIGQQWRTIEKAISTEGNDIVIVGRAVTGSSDMNTQIRRYRDAAWEAFISRQSTA